MNIQPVYLESEDSLWSGKLSKRSILNELSEHQSFQTEQNVKIEYINGYEEDLEEQPSLGVIVEKVEAPDRKPNISNLNDYNLNYKKHKLKGDHVRKGDVLNGNLSNGGQGVTTLIEKFESKMMQNISTTYTEVLNEISKSMNRIQVLAKDNAEYQEDCLRTNVSEICRHLKIFPKRTQPLQIDEENNAEKSDENQPITDEEEEEAERQPNDMFFSVVEKDQRIDVVASKKIKEEPYEPYSTISEEPEIEEYMPVFQDTNEDGLITNENGLIIHDMTKQNSQNNEAGEKEYNCIVCKNDFSTKFALQRHQRRNLKCSAAIMELKAKEEQTNDGTKLPLLKLFPTKSHQKFNPEVPYKPCFFCHHQFQRISELIGHLQAAHINEDMDHLAEMLPSLNKEDLKPEIIRKRLDEETYVKDESQDEFKGGINKCSFCPSEFASFSRLLSHCKFVHPECDKSQGHWTLKIFAALEDKFPSKRVPCDQCGSEIKLENLYKHKGNHNQKVKECPECGKSIQSKTYQMHLKTHIEQEWLCNECGKSFKTQKTYKKHILTHDPNFKGFECTECNKIFDTRPSLMTHVSLVHEKTKRFMCQYCSYVAGISGNLTFHIRRVHSKEKPSQCEECDYKTIGSQELMRHVVAVHRRDEHHKCDVCQWTTPRKHLMDMHNRLNCKKPPFTEEDRAKSKAILLAEAGPSKHIYSY